TQLPISEYPEVVPPSVVVTAQFPGANAKVIAETVATPLEEQINGVENLLYMNSQATSDGTLQLTVTFKLGTDPDLAQQLVQNRVNQALPRLPDVTRQIGVATVKSSPNFVLVVHLLSPDGRYDTLYLHNYAVINVKDELTKIPGVGQAQIFGGGDYAMRIWLNPEKVAARNLTASDVTAAIRRQNVQVSAGVIGGPPYDKGVELQLPINTDGRLQTPEQFGDIIIKRDDNGVITKLKDVADVTLDAGSYSLRSLLDNKSAVGIGIFQQPGSNAIEVSKQVHQAMERLKQNFPEGVDYRIVYDTTIFVRGSIEAVIHTLLEAVALVVLVVILFLQTWRASIIPLLAVPISIVGTFAVMLLSGFSINALSLFGLVLAIGIVVDDAIVVVENVERNIENGLSPRDATYQAMKEVTGPIIAIALCLCAVFVPIAFISGLTGQFYRQFALTIAFSTVISAFNSLTLSPALAALLLKPHDETAPKDGLTRFLDTAFGGVLSLLIPIAILVALGFILKLPLLLVLGAIALVVALRVMFGPRLSPENEGFGRFNRTFHTASEKYSHGVARVLRHKGLALIVYGALLGLTVLIFNLVPSGFVPVQDKQYLVAFAQLPEGATLDRTEKVIRDMSDIIQKEPGVANAVAFPGLSINGFINSSSAGIVFVTLKPFEERESAPLSGPALAQKLQGKLMGIKDAFVAIFPPPPVIGLGSIGGFKLQVEDRTDQGYVALDAVMKAVQAKAWQEKSLTGIFSSYQINTPQLSANLDRPKALQLGVDVQSVFDTMQVYLGSLYVNDFNKFGRTYQVIAQAAPSFRAHADDILRLQTRSVDGRMVPLGAMLNVSETFGPESASHYNAFRSADLNGGPAPGYSSGQAQAAITKILNETLPKGMGFEWTELTYQQILSGNTAVLVFPICVLLVFLVLAAQYESLFLPLAIILIVPMCLLSAIAGVWITGGDNNLFTQIGLFVLIGLACKNAILIVEFARELEMRGMATVEAAIEAAHLRLRPILMTSFAFIMGVVPLVVSHGAGAEMRHAMGVAVFAGMLGVTFFGLFLTPVFYVLMRALEKRITGHQEIQHHD
ncbi:MAG TPA: multidrug efflux RND transporter permease subunit, partial [Alphaproteobacteria bacterium]|nr:multidrug efflux RND transporter permease subunit [Alphaproteobacteria bacterium]